jgi:hypothetical protein
MCAVVSNETCGGKGNRPIPPLKHHYHYSLTSSLLRFEVMHAYGRPAPEIMAYRPIPDNRRSSLLGNDVSGVKKVIWEKRHIKASTVGRHALRVLVPA